MTKCHDLEALFAPYVDGEAAPAQRASVAAHLGQCPPCRDRIASEQAARDMIVAARADLRVCASGELRARCAAQCVRTTVAGAAVARTAIFRRAATSWLPLSLAATLVLAVGGVFLLGLNNSVEALAAELTLDHVKCFTFPPARVTADAAEAGDAWASVEGWTLQVPASLPAQQLELVCVRRCLITDGRMAHIMYRWRGAPLSVYVLPSSTGSRGHAQEPAQEPAQENIEKFGHEAVMWSGGERTYVVLARGRPDELAPVVEYVRASAR